MVGRTTACCAGKVAESRSQAAVSLCGNPTRDVANSMLGLPIGMPHNRGSLGHARATTTPDNGRTFVGHLKVTRRKVLD